MPKGTIVRPEVRALVKQLLNQDQKITGKLLKSKVEEEFPEHYSLRTYQKMKDELNPVITEAFASGKNSSWNIASIKDHPLAPEALPKVIKAWVHSREILKHDFTVRDAEWVARLYALSDDIAWLTGQALDCSLYEGMKESLDNLTWSSNKYILDLYEKISNEKLIGERREAILKSDDKKFLSNLSLRQHVAVIKKWLEEQKKQGGGSSNPG